MEFPTEEVEFGRCWSSAAGELSAMKSAIIEVERRSGEAFIRGRDEVANALRDLAVALGRSRNELERKVDGFIKEDARRKHELRRVLGH